MNENRWFAAGRRGALFVVLAVAGLGQEGDDPQPVHVFILSGQSNMAGLDPARTFTPAVTKEFGDGK